MYRYTTREDVAACNYNIVLPPTPCTATTLRGNSALTELILYSSDIDSTAMSHLHEGIANHPILRVLNLSENRLGTEGTRHLGKD